jgi:transposase-like protein
VIADNVVMAQSTLFTDSAQAYESLGAEMAEHGVVNHKLGEYVRQGISTNKAENYFSQLKRSLNGTHHHVSEEHLPHYLSEFDFRYSNRKLTDTERMNYLVTRVGGRRLAYKRSQ